MIQVGVFSFCFVPKKEAFSSTCSGKKIFAFRGSEPFKREFTNSSSPSKKSFCFSLKML